MRLLLTAFDLRLRKDLEQGTLEKASALEVEKPREEELDDYELEQYDTEEDEKEQDAIRGEQIRRQEEIIDCRERHLAFYRIGDLERIPGLIKTTHTRHGNADTRVEPNAPAPTQDPSRGVAWHPQRPTAMGTLEQLARRVEALERRTQELDRAADTGSTRTYEGRGWEGWMRGVEDPLGFIRTLVGYWI
ncbi:hypothetical protein MMC21_002740 [Puttea exsequens]|nr:hypothetical protein [Puttea exsequens]